MHTPITPIADIILKIMNVFLWLMILSAIGLICLMLLTGVIALSFVLLDISYDWSWMLSIGKT